MTSHNNDTQKMYQELSKQELLMEASCFNETNFNPKKCQEVLTKLIFFLDQGETLAEDEMSSLFFSITKLFQSNDKNLKRLLFLSIKYMKNTPSICMITNCITKDIQSNNPTIKANALRLLPLIIEIQNPVQLLRSLKLCLVYKNEVVVEAALTACLEIMHQVPDVVKKCQDEFMQILFKDKQTNTHYKAFILLKEIKKTDQISFFKLLREMIKKNDLYNQITMMYLIRSVGELMKNQRETLDQGTQLIFTKFLKDMTEEEGIVYIEALKAFCDLNTIDNSTLKPIVLQMSNAIEESTEIETFAILKIMKRLVQNSSRLSLFESTQFLQDLLHSEDTNIRALVIGILIKITPLEESQNLLTKIFTYLDDLPSTLQKDVIKNCLFFTQKSPKAFSFVFKFLTNCLKEKGDLNFRISIVEIFASLLESFPSKSETILNFCALYIEDSYDEQITLQILDIFCKYFQQVDNPTQYLKYLINRLALDSEQVRAATVTCLGQTAKQNKQFQEEVSNLFETLLQDNEEEVSSRCAYYLQCFDDEDDCSQEEVYSPEEVSNLLQQMEQNFAEENFDLTFISTSKINKPKRKFNKNKQRLSQQKSLEISKTGQIQDYLPINQNLDQQTEDFIQEQESLKSLGQVLHTTDYENVSDKDAEVYVQLRKHILEDYLLLEFVILNQQEITMSKLKMELEFDDEEGFAVQDTVAQHQIKSEGTGKVFVVLSKDCYFNSLEFNAVIHFEAQVMEDDEVINQYEDEFPLENFEVKNSDFFQKYSFEIYRKDFEKLWNIYEDQQEQVQNYQLDFQTVSTAIDELAKLYNLSICQDCREVDLSKNFHELWMAGFFNGRMRVLMQCKIGFDKNKKCIVSITVKSEDEELSQEMLDI